MALPQEKRDEEIALQEWNLLFGIRKSIRYHLWRVRHYEMWHAITLSVNVIAGSAAFGTVISGWKWVPAITTLIVAVLSGINLVIGTDKMARLHAALAEQFSALQKEIELAAPLSDEQVRMFRAKRLEIESKEPPILRALNRLCHNEEARALDCEDQVLPLTPFQRSLSQWFSFNPPPRAKSSSSPE